MVVNFLFDFFGGTLASCGGLSGGEGVGAVTRARRGASLSEAVACAVSGN